MGDEVIGRLWVMLGMNSEGLKQGKSEAESALSDFEKSIGASEGSMKKMAAGIGMVAGAELAVGAAMMKLASDAGDFGNTIEEQSRALGMSTTEYQQWRHVATAAGADADAFTSSVRMMSTRMKDAADPTSEMGKTLKALGVEVTSANGKFKSTDAVLTDTISAINKLPAGFERNQASMEIFGRSWAEMAPILELNNDQITKLKGQAPILTEEEIAQEAEFHTQMALVNEQLEMLYIELGTQVIPIIQSFMPVLNELMPYIKGTIDVVGTLTNGFVSLAEAAMAAQSAVQGVVSGDFSEAQTHLSNSVDAAQRSSANMSDLTNVGSGATAAKMTKGTAISKSKALGASRTGVTQNVTVNTVALNDSQIGAFVTSASKTLATQLSMVGL